MSCSALLETSSTYRNLLSTPSGSPSIAVLLFQSLRHRGDGFERSLRLQLPGDNRGLQALRRDTQVVVDDDVVVEILAFVDLVDRLPQPEMDLVVGVQAALAQPHAQGVERGRE